MHLVRGTLWADLTVWMPDWGIIPLTMAPQKKGHRGHRDAIDVTQTREGSSVKECAESQELE